MRKKLRHRAGDRRIVKRQPNRYGVSTLLCSKVTAEPGCLRKLGVSSTQEQKTLTLTDTIPHVAYLAWDD